MTPDQELLQQYAATGSESAFAELVRRHVDLVYSAALRLVAGDTHLAEDVTQHVFADLARQAGKLSARAALGGWLHTSARFAAMNAIRGEQRRRTREQEVAMQNNSPTTEIPWEQLRPLLDEAVGRLRETEREAVILRYFQGKSLREVGDALGLGENAARKRLDYALEKLQTDFARRGVQTTAVLLAEIIGGNSVQAAPASLAASVMGTSLAGQTVVGSTGIGAVLVRTFFMKNPIQNIIVVSVVAIAVAGAAWHLLSAQATPAKATTAVLPSSPVKSASVVVLSQPRPPVPAAEPPLKIVAQPHSAVNEQTSGAVTISAPVPVRQEDIDAAKAFVTQTVEIPLLTYRTATGYFPTSLQGLIHNTTGDSNWTGPYLNDTSLPKDPWGNEYQYLYPGIHNPTKYDMWSMGPDGISGTADDIGNW